MKNSLCNQESITCEALPGFAPIQNCCQCGHEIRECATWECATCCTRICWMCWDQGNGNCGQCRVFAGKTFARVSTFKPSPPWIERCSECKSIITDYIHTKTLCFWCSSSMCDSCFTKRYGICRRCDRHFVMRRPIGRPKVLRSCSRCSVQVSAREARVHRCRIKAVPCD